MHRRLLRPDTNLRDADDSTRDEVSPAWWTTRECCDAPGGPRRDSSKAAAVQAVARDYVLAFERRPLPEDYESLKTEARFLAGLSQNAFVLMAHRLLAIRDRQLYRQEGYPDFRSFVEAELPISKSTVYNYMDVVVLFHVSPRGCGPGIEYSKLIPALPLLRADRPDIPKAAIRAQLLEVARSASRRQMVRLSHRLREQYGVAGRTESSSLVRVLTGLRACLPACSGEADLRVLSEMREMIEAALGASRSDTKGGHTERRG